MNCKLGPVRAVVVEKPGHVEVTDVAEPSPGPGEVLIRVSCCGICGTDLHIVDGEFPPTPYPITPGHEFAGEVVAIGPDPLTGARGAPLIEEGALVAVDPSLFCGHCQPCRSGRGNLCQNWGAIGDTVDGAFAELVAVPAANVYRLPEGFDGQTGAMVEPLSCAVHGLDRLGPVVGRRAVLFGAGTMGLLLLAAFGHCWGGRRHGDRPSRGQTDGGKSTRGGGHGHQCRRSRWCPFRRRRRCHRRARALSRRPWRSLERGGRLLVFGVAPAEATVRLSPFRVYNDEITVIGSMAVLYSFDQAIDMLARGAVDVRPFLAEPMPLEQFDQALRRARAGEGVKTHVRP